MQKSSIILFTSSLLILIFLSGCIGKPTEKGHSPVGLTAELTTDVTIIKPATPLTFLASIKNLASEDVVDIYVHLTNLTGWVVENSVQQLSMLSPADTYKFSWLVYPPAVGNKSFHPVVKLYYETETKLTAKIRVYDNDYLNSLELEKRKVLKEAPALIFSSRSTDTPIAISLSLQQPFILTSYEQEFPFIVQIVNKGLGKPYSPATSYLLLQEESKDFVSFSYSSNYTLQCNVGNNVLLQLVNGTANVVCKLTVVKTDVQQALDILANFTVEYAYLDELSIEVSVV